MKVQLLFAGICVMLFGIFIPSFKVSAEELEEYVGYITDPEFQGIVEEEISNLVSARTAAYTLNWTVPANTRYATAYFHKDAGTSVVIALELSKSAMAGILSFSGEVRYVKGTSLYHGFSITESDSYKVFVQNTNSSSITAKGYYYR